MRSNKNRKAREVIGKREYEQHKESMQYNYTSCLKYNTTQQSINRPNTTQSIAIQSNPTQFNIEWVSERLQLLPSPSTRAVHTRGRSIHEVSTPIVAGKIEKTCGAWTYVRFNGRSVRVCVGVGWGGVGCIVLFIGAGRRDR